MNKHIEVVKKWLDNPDSLTQEELDLNADAAWTVWSAAWNAIDAAACGDDANAAYWVNEYEELTNE
ncbi:MAG: hypothetical protein ACO23H_12020 [Alphaproteobacteria bacterium]